MARAPLRRQGLAIPDDLGGRVAPGVLPVVGGIDVPGRSETTRGLRGLVDSLRSTADQMADRKASDAAWEAGTTEGDANPGARMDGGGVLYRSAYNRAAADSAGRRLEINARTELNRLIEQHGADPDSFNAAAQAWRDGAARGLPPGVRVAFQQRFDAAALPFAAQVRDNLRRRVADDAVATFTALEPERTAAVERAAAQAVTDPAAAAALRSEEENHLAQLAALGPREGFTIAGRTFPPDPSRAGALSATQVAERWVNVERTRNTSAVVAAWRAAGGSAEWIAAFERNAGGGVDADGAVMRRIFRAENAAGDSRRNAMGSSASGPGQITDETWRAYAPRLGLTDAQRTDRAAHERVFQAYMGDAERAVGRPLSAGEQYAAWFLGVGGLRAFLAAGPNADARATFRTVATEQRTALAFRQNPGVMQDGMTTGQVLAELSRRIAPRGQEAEPGMPRAEVSRISTHLRSLLAAERQADAEGRAEARAELNRVVSENLAAIGEAGEPTRPIDPSLVLRAGEDLGRLAERERLAREAFVAGRTARDATDPAELARLAAEFAPGTPNFRADPRAASAVLASLRQRGVAVEGAALAERVRDLAAEAEATGEDRAITPEEARAAGLAPERAAEVNRDLAARAEAVRLRQAAMAMPEAEREAALTALPVAGPDAAENARRAQLLAGAFADRDRAIREDPAMYALTGLPRAARALAGRAGTGDPAALRDLAGLLAAEQDRLGVPPAERRGLPRAMTDGLLARVLDAPGPDEALGALSALTGAVGVPEAARLIAAVRASGDAQEPRRRAVAVAAAMLGEQPMMARRILAGAIFLRDNPVPGSGAEAPREAQAALREAFEMRPQAVADVQAAAMALYASRRDLSPQTFNARAYRDALAELAPTTRFAGRETALPQGMDADRFHALMAALPPERLDGARAADGRPITPAMIARGGFQAVAVAPGRYVLNYGAHEVADAARPDRRFVLDLNGAVAQEPGGMLGNVLDGAFDVLRRIAIPTAVVPSGGTR